MPTWYQAILSYVISEAVMGLWLACLFQVNHVVATVNFTKADENNYIDQCWAKLQVENSQDYAHGSAFWTFFSGALNYQVVHHLFPDILQCYYPEIAPIVRKTCQEFGVKYEIRVRGRVIDRKPFGKPLILTFTC